MEIIFVLLIAAPGILALTTFVTVLARGKDKVHPLLRWLSEAWSIGFLPVFALSENYGRSLDCCRGNLEQLLAGEHTLTVGAWWLVTVLAYVYVRLRSRPAGPLVEVGVTWTLLFGIAINVALMIQDGLDVSIFVCPVIILYFLVELYRQHVQITAPLHSPRTGVRAEILDYGLEEDAPDAPEPAFAPTGWLARVHYSPWVIKYPVLFVLGLPIFAVVSTILLLFGQRHDSLVLAFTQTYYQTFSELTAQCEGVTCGGHYLCSVAANGHHRVVRPLRWGTRHGRPIICNRQLLLANAFEEIIQERWPGLHRYVRRKYDRVGDFIHRDYSRYENPWLCDAIYVLMKPVEWLFLVVIYCVDQRPEARIARQYRTQ